MAQPNIKLKTTTLEKVYHSHPKYASLLFERQLERLELDEVIKWSNDIIVDSRIRVGFSYDSHIGESRKSKVIMALII